MSLVDVRGGRVPPLRYANRAIVSQYQAYLARPWAPGDARTTVRPFACECGRDGCEEQVELAIADFPEPPASDEVELELSDHGEDLQPRRANQG